MKINKNEAIEISYEQAKKVMNFGWFVEIPTDEHCNDMYSSEEEYVEELVKDGQIQFFVFLQNGKLYNCIESEAQCTAGNNEYEECEGVDLLRIDTSYTGYDNITYDAIVIYNINKTGEIEIETYDYIDNGEYIATEEKDEFLKIINKEIYYAINDPINFETIEIERVD